VEFEISLNRGFQNKLLAKKIATNKMIAILEWRRRDSNPGPNTATVEPSTCLVSLNFRDREAV